MSTWFFTTFSVSGMKQKVHHVETLQQLFTCILPEQIDIPPFVLEYDARVRPYTHHSLCLAYQPYWPTSTGLHTHTHSCIELWVYSHIVSDSKCCTLCVCVTILKCNMYLIFRLFLLVCSKDWIVCKNKNNQQTVQQYFWLNPRHLLKWMIHHWKLNQNCYVVEC